MDSPSPPAEKATTVAGSPSDFLKNIVGKKVKVRIGNGLDYHGESLVSDTSSGEIRSRLGAAHVSVIAHLRGDNDAMAIQSKDPFPMLTPR